MKDEMLRFAQHNKMENVTPSALFCRPERQRGVPRHLRASVRQKEKHTSERQKEKRTPGRQKESRGLNEPASTHLAKI